MDLKTLLNDARWQHNNLSYETTTLEDEITRKTQKPIQRVLGNAKRGIRLNTIILVVFLGLYFIFPNPTSLLAILLITGCYLFILITLIYGLVTLKEPDLNQDITKALKAIIQYDDALYKYQCKYFSVTLTIAYMGGFLLGLGFQGYTPMLIIEKWPLLIILVAGAAGMYYYSKTKAFKSFNRSLNPNYFRSKNILKEQLEILNSINYEKENKLP